MQSTTNFLYTNLVAKGKSQPYYYKIHKTSKIFLSVFGDMLIECKILWGILERDTTVCMGIPFSKMPCVIFFHDIRKVYTRNFVLIKSCQFYT
jgi:hypothetical protein